DKSLAPDETDGGLRIEGNQLETRAHVFERVADGRLAAPRNQLVEVLGLKNPRFDSLITAAPVDRAERAYDRMIGRDTGHDSEQSGRGEQIVGGQLDEADTFSESAADDAGGRNARGVSRDHLHHTWRKCAAQCQLAIGAQNRSPSIEQPRIS